MAKELIIVFLYDTQIQLKEEDDPQKAVVYFYPSWVSGNQRMALCGQLMGVTQFLDSNFSFPHVLALKCGKFVVRKVGRFMLCVGTDRNISDWVLQKRADALHSTIRFFHHNLNNTADSYDQVNMADYLTRIFEIYLPVLIPAGDVFVNTPTIRLPKSASSIFLEAAQILECLQDKSGVHGGAIFYQNKVVMSQLNTEITKQLVMTDPYRIKLPAEYIQTSFHLPVGVQLLLVYVEEYEINQLKKDALPSKSFIRDKLSQGHHNKALSSNKKSQSRIFTVVEEEIENETSPLKLANMPDLVKDTMKLVPSERSKNEVEYINISSRVVGNHPIGNVSYSVDNLTNNGLPQLQYYSFDLSNIDDKLSSSQNSLIDSKQRVKAKKLRRKCGLPNLNVFYNTICDPVFPWFRYNGLPASKALLDDRIAAYYRSMDTGDNKSELEAATEQTETEDRKQVVINEPAPIRPTSISFSTNGVNRKKAEVRRALSSSLKNAEKISEPKENGNVPLTPLMAKLQLLEQEENKSLVTPLADSSKTDVNTSSETAENSFDGTVEEAIEQSYSKYLNIRKKDKVKRQRSKLKMLSEPKKCILYVFGQQNVSIFLLMDETASKDPDLIHYLWKICFNCVSDLERQFRQCFDSLPTAQGFDSSSADSYSYINIHSGWETLQKGGTWTAPQLEMLSSLHNSFNNASNITDITIRTDDGVIYGNQLGDNQVFYHQPVNEVAGLPMPSDLMGLVPVKAKRRLERDHGILLI